MKSLTLLASLAFVSTAMAAAVAAPTTEPEAPIVHSTFSFADWVDKIMTDPDHALSPDAAVDAFEASSASKTKRQTFANCQQLGHKPANVRAAVWCIDHLARRGHHGDKCDVSGFSDKQCTHNVAQIVTVNSGHGPNKVNCNAIARAGGLIMDKCTRGDHTVSGEAYIPGGGVAVHIQEPLI